MGLLTKLRASQTVAAAAGLVALGAAFGAMRWLGLEGGGLAARIPEFVAVALAAGAVYCATLYALRRVGEQRAAWWLILGGALVFRWMLFPVAPTLSEDIYRYRWDAHVYSAGWNPYTVAPNAPRLAELRAAHIERFPGQEISSIYPPLTQHVYRAMWRVAGSPPERESAVLFKLPAVAADLLIVCLLAAWLHRARGTAAQLATYAWNPLVIFEFAGSGHNDALALLALVAALLLIMKWRDTLSTALLAAAAMLKAFPVVLLPLWLRRAGWPRSKWGWLNLAIAAGVMAAAGWPFRDAWPGILDVGAQFAGGWRHNNASLYSLVAWFTGSEQIAGGLALGVVAGLAVWTAARRMESARAAFLLFGAILLLSPNAFPWYFTWLVPLLVFLPNPAWTLLTVTQFLSYHVVINYVALGRWEFQTEMLWLTYAPFFAFLVARRWLKGSDEVTSRNTGSEQ